MGRRFARACTLSLSFLSQICFCGSRTALPLPQIGRGYKEREGHRERKRESALKKKEERTSEAQASAARFCDRAERSRRSGESKKKKTDSLKFEFTRTEKPALNKRPLLESISLSL